MRQEKIIRIIFFATASSIGIFFLLLFPKTILADCNDPNCSVLWANHVCLPANNPTYHCWERPGTPECRYEHLSGPGDICPTPPWSSGEYREFYSRGWSCACEDCCFGGGGGCGVEGFRFRAFEDMDADGVKDAGESYISKTTNVCGGDPICGASGCRIRWWGGPNPGNRNDFNKDCSGGWEPYREVRADAGTYNVRFFAPDGWEDTILNNVVVPECTRLVLEIPVEQTSPPPFCSYATLSPAGFSLNVGDTQPVVVASLAGTANLETDVARVDFSSTDTGIITVSPSSDNTFPYETVATGVSPGGPANVLANVVLSVGGGCAGNSTVTVNASADAWWQTTGGDVHAAGLINDPIPNTATEAYCSLVGDGGYPGVISYGGGSAEFDEGDSSTTGWLANSAMMNYNYDFFFNNLDSPEPLSESPSPDDMNGLDGFYLVGGGGNLTLPDSVWNITNQGQKVTILVPGNLTIRARFNVGKNDNFLGFFVGGNIIVEDDVVGAGINPAIEGIFFADGNFSTGTGDVFNTEGMFYAGSFSFSRDLGDSNDDTPAESFTYRPDLWLTSPQEFWETDFTWQELAP